MPLTTCMSSLPSALPRDAAGLGSPQDTREPSCACKRWGAGQSRVGAAPMHPCTWRTAPVSTESSLRPSIFLATARWNVNCKDQVKGPALIPETQRGKVTGPRSHKQIVAEAGLERKSSCRFYPFRLEFILESKEESRNSH